MSRIGKKPIDITNLSNLTWFQTPDNHIKIIVSGKLGTLEKTFLPCISFKKIENSLVVIQENFSRFGHSYFGLVRMYVNNMILGVSDGFIKTLTAEGIGFKFQKLENILILNMGFTHVIKLEIPVLINIFVESPAKIILKSIDKEILNTFVAKIREIKPPEPYKGKGIYVDNEQIKRKAGKTNKK